MTTWRCRVFDHDFRFRADGAVLAWSCRRDCAAAGQKTYADAAAASRYARVFDRRDTDQLGRRAPLVGLLPLRLWRRLVRPAQERPAGGA